MTPTHAATLLISALLLAAPSAAQGRVGSIYDPAAGPIGMITDKTARRPGDVLTVVINEEQDVTNAETSTLKKETTLDYQLSSFNLKPNAFTTLPGITAESQDDFTGSANYAKSGSFSARISTIVLDVLPNGNMIIEGRREIRVDHETKVITFRGVVRPYDIRSNNTVESELVAQAQISYVGSGPLTESTNRVGLGRLLHTLISWIWPF